MKRNQISPMALGDNNPDAAQVFIELDNFRDYLISKGADPVEASVHRRRCEVALDAARGPHGQIIHFTKQINARIVGEAFRKLIGEGGLKQSTSKSAVASVRCFGRWLFKSGRLPRDPLQSLRL